ncbi:oligopeptide ABC transporter, ATP-binding protein [Candidatus Vecturithrix granuli]|uniref:Oligopeptide ABC transporter, ATP-binding protein n=1 Tax=Vecturithrix granuli TaxID=1499967 RepID=A0A081BVR0_VECG1|nr:oligopeptide ABC transporter, ATP-binding protein [Candidatus Vecturithrix granuli]
MSTEIILEARHLKKYFPVHSGLLLKHTADVRAVDDVSFVVKRGETLGLVGESGCGKSTLGRTLLRLYEPTAGEILYNGEVINRLTSKQLKPIRRNMQMIFQDPYESLNPRMTAASIVSEPFRIHKIGTRKEQRERTEELFEQVGLKRSQLDLYPHEFSGGQRQRISIARAIALNPDLIVCDESVSALDVSVQAQILNLLKDLQQQLHMTYLFISHDLSVIEHVCNRIVVMYLGKIVEFTDRDTLFDHSLHPYTQALIDAVPVAGRGKRRHGRILQGDVPNPMNPPSGCYFHPRCARCMERCKHEAPTLIEPKGHENHWVSCWLYE